jgi:hypothetical protein
MKKLIILVIALVCSYTMLLGQNTTTVIGTDTIYLPQIAQDGCYNVCDSGCVNLANNPDPNLGGPGLGDNPATSHFIAEAQPYFTDNAISIKGIAFCGMLDQTLHDCSVSNIYNNGFYVTIWDSATNAVLAQARYDTLTQVNLILPGGITFGPTTHTYKVYFDSSIMVSGNFLVGITISTKAPSYFMYGVVYAHTGTCANGNTYPSPLIMWDDSTNTWEQWRTSTNALMTNGNNNLMNILFIYPILGEKHNIDTTSSISQVDIKDAVTLYPNPASNKLYLASSFGINKIEVFNIIGQKLKEDEVNCSNYNLDISNFVKGNYIIKIITPRGTTEKKFIKE